MGYPVEVFEMFDKSVWAVAVPVIATTVATTVQNLMNPKALE